jgi:hypothetical protein
VLAALADGPPPVDGGSGYPDWDRLVRSTVCWVAKHLDIGAGFADPARSLLAGYEEDPERDRLRSLLTSWRASFGDEPVTVNLALDRVNRAPLAAELETGPPYEALGQLHDVLAEIDGRLRSHPIGIYLNQQKGRIVDGLELVAAGKQCNSNRWVVRRAGPETATAVVAEDGV